MTDIANGPLIVANLHAEIGDRDAELSRLTRELDEAKKENERLRLWVFGPLPAAPNEAEPT